MLKKSKDLKPEAVEAKENLDDLKKMINGLVQRLTSIAGKIKEIEDAADDTVDENGTKKPRGPLKLRIKFDYLKAIFFVDFFIAPKGSSDDYFLEGHIIYGASRSTVEKQDSQDKVLFDCPISGNGLIKDPGGIKGQWIIDKGKASNFEDVHYLILANIWDSALNWVNEYPAN